MKVYLAMYNNKKTLTDKLISFVSRGPYSHCEVIVGDMAFSASVRDGEQVRSKPVKDLHLDNGNWDVFPLFDINPLRYEGFVYWFKNLEGIKYGFKTLVFNHLLRIPLNFRDEYICSEVCYDALKKLALSAKTDEYVDDGYWDKEMTSWELTPTSMLAYLKKYIHIGDPIKDLSIFNN